MKLIPYPGPAIWIKRLMYTMVLCTVGGNMFLSELQSYIWQQTQEMISTVEPYLSSASSVAGMVEGSLIPLIETLEQSRFGSTVAQIDVPRSADLQYQVNEIKALEYRTKRLDPLLGLTIKFMWLTSILMWFPILLALLWLLKDLEKGQWKALTLLYIFFALLFNFWSYDFLYGLYPIA